MGPSEELNMAKSVMVADREDLKLLFLGEVCKALADDEWPEPWAVEERGAEEMGVGPFDKGTLAKVSRQQISLAQWQEEPCHFPRN
jgi:hypothetical protein